jgi:membrane protease subunit (stomatin/prohibitin family)
MEKKRIKGRKCQKCSHGNPIDCKFCRKCGAAMDEQKKVSSHHGSRKKEAPSDEASTNAELQRLVGSGSSTSAPNLGALGKVGKKCPSCGKGNPVDGKFCKKCGAALADVKAESLSDSLSLSSEESDKDIRLTATKKSAMRRSSRRAEPAKAEPASTDGAGHGAVPPTVMVLPPTSSDSSDTERAEGAAKAKTLPRSSRRASKRTPLDMGGIKCGGCGKKNAAGMKFCKSCGHALEPPQLSVTTASTLDTNGAHLGASLSASAPALPRLAARPSDPTPLAQNICPSCNHENALTDKFCLECGTKLGGGQLNATVPMPEIQSIAVQAPTETKCKECGTWNEPGCKVHVHHRFCKRRHQNPNYFQRKVAGFGCHFPTLSIYHPSPLVLTHMTRCAVLCRLRRQPCGAAAVNPSAREARGQEAVGSGGRPGSPHHLAAARSHADEEVSPLSTPQRRGHEVLQEVWRRAGRDQQGEGLLSVCGPGSTIHCTHREHNTPVHHSTQYTVHLTLRAKVSTTSESSDGGDSEPSREGRRSPASSKKKKARAGAGEPMQDCRQCGKANPVGNVFCKKCGTRFAAQKKVSATVHLVCSWTDDL